MKKLRQKIYIALFLSVFSNTLFAQSEQSSTILKHQEVLLDSLLNTFSLEELARFKEFYQNEINLFEKETNLLREKGVNDGEKIYAINPNGQFMDKVLFRLAEFYYQKEQDELFKKMEKYEKEFVRFENGERADIPEEPKPDYKRVIEKYEMIVSHFSQSQLLDDVLYHLAFTYEKNFEYDKALKNYKQVAGNYPNSKNAPEAIIRIGEYYFEPVRRNLNEAVNYYVQVLNYKDTPRYNEALYKLGWCYYLQEEYDHSIETFALLVQDIEKNVVLDPFGEYTNPSLKEEALEYIGICFHDAGGLPRALAFIDSLSRPEYSTEILTKLGDVYLENEEKFVQATYTFMALLERFPYCEKAPEIQEKIVACARKLEDDNEIYLAQLKLFDDYNPNSEWSLKISDIIEDPEELKKTLETASQKSEFALRDNINLSIRLGEETQDQSYYQLAVNDAKKYLSTFPYDTSAYAIHWNTAVIMDTKIGQKDEAYQAYLDICNNYIQDKFKKFAAQNVIVLAREITPALNEADSATISDSLSILAQAELTQAHPDSNEKIDDNLTPSQSLLVDAYNNFIKHFPHEEEASVVLANVGNLYYNNQDFNDALLYFNTLMSRFPDSPNSKQALLTAMESYFGKRDFSSTEIIAKKIQMNEKLPEEFREKAKGRLAESIYLHAEALVGEKEHLKAANEFKRVIEEVPNVIFVDKAYFQAGVQYDLAKEFSMAIEMYSQMISQFPKSEHYLDAVNNLALDYGELNEYLLAAQTYETLSENHPDSSKVQDALFNASFFYVQAKDWQNSIRANRLYVEKYPRANDAEDMFYNMAEYYLKLDDFDHANEIYGEFATKYPESPRAVETYFKRGDYFKGKGRIFDAIQEFDLAVQKNNELKAKNLPANDFYAAEALFAKSEKQYADYITIRFARANLESTQRNKKNLLQQLVKQYTEVASLGTVRIYEAMYKISRLYENFATTWAEQEIPNLSENEKIVFVNNLNQASSQLYDQAFVSYKSNYKSLTKMADSYQPEQVDSIGTESIRVVAEDSTIRVASRWINLTGTKMSEMLYKVADLNYSSIDRFISAPIPGGLDEVSSLEYRNQVLAKAVFPVVQEITQAHLRNLSEADSLQIQNSWVDKSQDKLNEVMSILPGQYKQLCLDAFETYSKKYNDYTAIMTKGTVEQQENAIDIAGQMVNILELSKNYATLMIANYKVSIDHLTKNVIGQLIAQALFNDCVNTTAQLATNFKDEAIECRNLKDHFTILNQQNPQMVYEDAIYTYSDGETYLRDNSLAICETIYQLKQNYDFPSVRFAKLASLLVELNPQTYAAEFELEVDEVKLAADGSWIMTTEEVDSTWMLNDFSANSWQSSFVQTDSTGKNEPTILGYVVENDTTNGDSLAFSTSTNETEIPEKFYLRKEIEINDIPLSATLSLNADDNVWVYLNGIEAFSEADSGFGWGNVFETDLTPFLKSGKNTLAILVQDIDQSGNGIQPVLKLQTIYRDKLIEQEQKLYQKELENFGISDIDVLIFNRYFVPQQ